MITMKINKNTAKYTAIGIIIILIAINIYIYTRPQPKYQEACFKDLCFYSQQHPTQHIEELLETSNESHIVFAGDHNKTEDNSVIFKASNTTIDALARRTRVNQENIHDIAYKHGEPIQCGEEHDNKTLEYCQTIQPKQNQLLIRLNYPNKQQNNVTIENRTITVNAKNPQSLLGSVKYITDKFIYTE